MYDTILLAFRVERRSVALCQFRGLALEYCTKRELPTGEKEAERSVLDFVRRACERFSPARIAVESEDRLSDRRATFVRLLSQVATDHGVPLWRISQETLFGAFGEPPLRSRAELRRIAGGLWPQLVDRRFSKGTLDAAALGLNVQVDAQLRAHEAEGAHDVAV